MPAPPPLRTVFDVADVLKVSPRTVYRFVERGEIDHIRISSGVRFTDEQISTFIDRRTNKATRLRAAV